ncbi:MULTISPECIES: ubiquinone anaerobic biosynthesis accessory factor UbiT [Chromobacterium]|uniref:Ubiquinone biosynthesis accessory factor UbiT n=1 Tax=Chromobacterium aquaticum TaxID=467180 RepID=A0ABV8ZXH5_9NEIS|nr:MULTISPECIES: SCP2 sterol-binding domain-containing protein [Chromobacterium]KMN37039.1 Sterol-binding domain protein [Chromobacterium sp. LK1]MCD5361520.1 SCP2 sterol-binding domain-containing protein [Chromobacterium aquaticum]
MRIPDLALPSAAATLLSRLPATPPAWLLAASLNQLARRGVLPAEMELLAGRRFAIRVLDAGLTLRFRADAQGFHADSADGDADLRLSATLADFARMMLREEDPDTLFFHRKLQIEGDTELGLIVKNLLDSVDWSATPLARFMAA